MLSRIKKYIYICYAWYVKNTFPARSISNPEMSIQFRIKNFIKKRLRQNSLLYIIVKLIYTILRELIFFPVRVFHLLINFYRYLGYKLRVFPVKYEAWYETDIDFTGLKTDIKAIAFYLPQFHQIPENDQWWGEGFTEWTNTRKATPLFKGHYQPREPHPDIGHYDLTDINVMRNQVEMARRHGIYGFCFYHYWFSGKRLLEKPLDLLLECPEIDFPFCLCWANENWTRRWDGGDKTILMKQEYNEGDAQAFIEETEQYLRDERYIKFEGKPLISIYHISDIPDAKSWISVWREHCRKVGIGEISIYAVYHSALNKDAKAEDLGVDGFIEFPPHHCQSPVTYDKTYVYDYKNHAKIYGSHISRPKKCIKAVMLGWDNTARKGSEALLFDNFDALDYYKWLREVISYTLKNFQALDRLVFINAWNEWAEGTYLEPDKKYGYNSLNITSRALFDLPYNYKPEGKGDDIAVVQTEKPTRTHDSVEVKT